MEQESDQLSITVWLAIAGGLIPRPTPPAGFEPATNRLTVDNPTAEDPQRIVVPRRESGIADSNR